LPQDELARLTGGLHFPYRQLILHASRGFRGDACDAPVSCQSTRVERGRRTREAGVPGTPEMPRVTTDRTVPGGRCHLLESGESLRGLWIARYLPSGKERKRRSPQALWGPIGATARARIVGWPRDEPKLHATRSAVGALVALSLERVGVPLVFFGIAGCLIKLRKPPNTRFRGHLL